MEEKTRKKYETLSGIRIKAHYGPEDVPDEWLKQLTTPGEPPYIRGIHSEGYRKRLPTIRQFCGEGTAPMTNKRLHYLKEKGQTGQSIAYDQPTLHGRDSDNENRSYGYVGKDGVAIDTRADFEDMQAGFSRGDYALSQTISFPAIVFLGFDLVLAKEQKIPQNQLRGTLQSDMRKEAISQKEYWYPVEHSMRLEADMIEYAVKNLGGGYYMQSASDYHMTEAGASSAQGLAFTLLNALSLVGYCLARGMSADDAGGRISFFFNCKNELDLAKFRAARYIWYTEMKKRGATSERALKLKFHVQNSGAGLMKQQPLNNIVRGAFQCRIAYRGGAQSIHINSWDEVFALPSEEAVTLAVRTQQIVGEEMYISDVADFEGGGWALEAITYQMVQKAYEYFKRVEKMGGMVKAIELGYPQLEIRKTALEEARRIANDEKIIVGFNKYADKDPEAEEKRYLTKMTRLNTLEIHEEQKKRARKVKAGRDNSLVEKLLKQVSDEARGNTNLVEPILKAVEAYATVEEIMFGALAPVFGRWRGPGD